MRYLIVDDEPLARERMGRLLLNHDPSAKFREAANGEAALALCDEYLPDIVLLDIRMPGMDGIAVARALSELPQPPAIVFCTAYDQYALQALECQAVAYLLKPVRQTDLAKALSKAGRVNKAQLIQLAKDQANEGETLVSQVGSELETVDLAQVLCFVATEKLTIAHTPRGEHVIHRSLKELEQQLSESFIRVHRNALVAIDRIRALTRDTQGQWVLTLKEGDVSPVVSRRHYGAVKQCLHDRAVQ